MGYRKGKEAGLSADEFMARHEREFSESEEIASVRLLTSLYPDGKIPASWLMAPSPSLEAWQQAIAKLPGHRLIHELKDYWRIRLLRAAVKEGSPEAYRELLEGLLIRLGVEAPEGVFLSSRRSRGAPPRESTAAIYRLWLQNNRPGYSALAHAVYQAEYIKANAQERKKLRDRCRRAVQRCEARGGDQNR